VPITATVPEIGEHDA
jgi:hypothetical protein